MQALEATVMCPANLIQISLEPHELFLLILDLVVKLGDFDLGLLLILLKLGLHLEGFPLCIVKLIVSLAEDPLHLVELLAHGRIFVLEHSEVAHGLSQWVRQYLLKCA